MFKRISNLIQGFLSLFISNVERQNPKALLEVEKENLRAQLVKYNKGLASHAGLVERLSSQVKKQTEREEKLRAEITANLRANNRERAAKLALELQKLQRDLAENRKQLEQGEATYHDLLRAREVTVNAARSKIESLKYAISDMEIKRATAELNEMASGMVTSIGGSGDNLDRLQEMVEEERSEAAGRARVARDSLDLSGIAMKEAEEQALADQALADFAAKEGIALDPRPVTTGPVTTGPVTGGVVSDTATTDTAKTMGPVPEIN